VTDGQQSAPLEVNQWDTLIDWLDPDQRLTYLLWMLVRLLRQALTILVVSTYLGATMLAAASMANSAPAPMNGMTHEQGGMGEPGQGAWLHDRNRLHFSGKPADDPARLRHDDCVVIGAVLRVAGISQRALDQARSRPSHIPRLI
jgi:hypothetical protein